MSLSRNELTTLFEYRDGHLFWRVTRSPKVKAGDVAGWQSPAAKKGRGKPYLRVQFEGKAYYVHRIIYALHYDAWPKVVDHVDGNVLNNKIENLRPCSQLRNSSNRKRSKANKSGVTGVYPKGAKWRANIRFQRRLFHLGTFPTKQEAIDARVAKQDELFGEFQRKTTA